MRLPDLSTLHGNVANDVWPNGAILSCKQCGSCQRITSAQAGGYLAKEWPKHCGATMGCEPAAKPSNV